MDKTIFIYSDGACSGNPGPGGWAVVIIFPEGRVLELGGGERPSTSNRMEMTGAIAALSEVLDRPEPVKLYTDSALLVNGIKGWIHAWKRKGRLSWGHVKGHAGHEINERCDVIAVAFSKGTKLALYDGPAVGCGYSLFEPGPEHLHTPGEPGKSAKSKPPKHGYYLSLIHGQVFRDNTWPICQARVHGVHGAKFKKVAGADDEEAALKLWGAR